MKKALLIIILCLPFLTGCGLFHFFDKPVPPIVPPNQVVQLDPKLYEPCAIALSSLNSNASFEDLLSSKKEDVKIYSECANKQNASIILLKKFSNKE